MLDRAPLADSKFADAVTTNCEHRDTVIAIRRVLGHSCQVPRKSIRADDLFEELTELMCFEWDELDFVFRMEMELNCKIVRASLNFPALELRSYYNRRPFVGTKVGDWIASMAPQIAILSQAAPPT